MTLLRTRRARIIYFITLTIAWAALAVVALTVLHLQRRKQWAAGWAVFGWMCWAGGLVAAVWGYTVWSRAELLYSVAPAASDYHADRVLERALPIGIGVFYVMLTQSVLFIAQAQDHHMFELWAGLAWMLALIALVGLASSHLGFRHISKRAVDALRQ